jgi:DNA processing protein
MTAPTPTDTDRALLALTLIPGLGPVRIARLLESLGSPQSVLSATTTQLRRIPGIGEHTASKVIQSRPGAVAKVDDELAALDSAGAHLLTILSPHYPERLRSIPAAPPILQIRGSTEALSAHHTLAIVGSRASTIYGVEQTRRFATTLGSAGFTIVSGGARGIDAAAHTAALDQRAPTIVVQGCGLAHTYPAEHADLYERVADSGGAVISELPFRTPPSADNFPARNRIISGLALAVLVIEAGHRSGALITARHAVEDHHRDVFAIPGRIDSSASAGSNKLLQDGAHLVTDPSQIIEILGRSSHSRTHNPTSLATNPNANNHPAPNSEPLPPLDPESQRLLDALSEPRTADQLAESLAMSPAQIRAKATLLEIQGRITRAGSNFQRTR